MKKVNGHQIKPRYSIESFNYEDQLDANELGKIIDIAGKESAIDHNEIRELTKIILKIDPAEVDEPLQAKFNKIMKKVKTQYAWPINKRSPVEI